MIMAAVSKMGIARLFFVEPGVKVNSKYYRDVLLSQQMLSAIRHVVADNFLSFSMTVHLRIGRVRQSNSCTVKHLMSFLQSYGRQQSGPEPH